MAVMIDGVSHVDTEELYELMNNPEKKHVLVVDVREPEEYIEGHIPGVPLLPMGRIPEVLAQMDPSCDYIFVCRSGIRSFQVAKYLQMYGFQHVHNYLGGMLTWDKDIADGPEHVIEQFSMQALQRKA